MRQKYQQTVTLMKRGKGGEKRKEGKRGRGRDVRELGDDETIKQDNR